MELRWQDLSEAEREREYSPSSCLPDGDYRPFIAEYRTTSTAAWAAAEADETVVTTVLSYGSTESQTIDVAVPSAETPVPLVIFIHGGYWQELSKLDSRFPATGCLRNGWGFAAVEYTLAPAANLDEIVAECRQAVTALRAEAQTLGVDPDRFVVGGSSAGAHLAAMVALDRTASRLSGLVLVSGVFELEPLIGTSINDALGLDSKHAADNSPARADLTGFPPTAVAYGENETSEFKAQSHLFARQLKAAGVTTSTIEIPGKNHFDVILDLTEPNTALGDATAAVLDHGGEIDA